MQFWQHNNGKQFGVVGTEQVFNWGIRFQILCRDQDELDLLEGYKLMYGKDVQVDIWDEWKRKDKSAVWGSTIQRQRLLPITFTTWPDANLRGL